MARPNGMSLFAESLRPQLERETGRRLGNKKELIELAGPHWQKLDPTDKNQWKAYAKGEGGVNPLPAADRSNQRLAENIRRNEKRAMERKAKCQALAEGRELPPTSSNRIDRHEQKRLELSHDQVTQQFYTTSSRFAVKQEMDVTRSYLSMIIPKIDELMAMEHAVVHVVPLYALHDSLDYVPAEIAVAKFSLDEGLIECKSWAITLPRSAQMTPERKEDARAREVVHKIPLYGYDSEEDNFHFVNDLISMFLELDEMVDTVGGRTSMMLALGTRKNYNQIQGSFKWLSEQVTAFIEEKKQTHKECCYEQVNNEGKPLTVADLEATSAELFNYDRFVCLESFVHVLRERKAEIQNAPKLHPISASARDRNWTTCLCSFHDANNPLNCDGCATVAVKLTTRRIFEELAERYDLDLECHGFLPELALTPPEEKLPKEDKTKETIGFFGEKILAANSGDTKPFVEVVQDENQDKTLEEKFEQNVKDLDFTPTAAEEKQTEAPSLVVQNGLKENKPPVRGRGRYNGVKAKTLPAPGLQSTEASNVSQSQTVDVETDGGESSVQNLNSTDQEAQMRMRLKVLGLGRGTLR